MEARERLIRTLRREGISSAPVLAALATVPRDRFVPKARVARAWDNYPLSIGHGQTVSQPYTVAQMLVLSGIRHGSRVYEVGAGCGYFAALVAEIVGKDVPVYAVERIPELADAAARNLSSLGYDNVTVECGDGKLGKRETAPYDAIIVSAQASEIPADLLDQLALDGRLVIPIVQGFCAEMTRFVRHADGIEQSVHGSYSFVPLL